MREGWRVEKLEDFTKTINGLWTGKQEPFVPVQVYTMSNFTKESDLDPNKEPREILANRGQYDKRKLEYGDILIEKSGGGPNQPVGRAIFFNINNGENNTFSNFTTRLRISPSYNKKIDSSYVHKYLKYIYMIGETEKFQKNSTNIRNLQLKEYLNIEVPIPPLQEQKQIVAILDQAFTAIDQAMANIEKNIANAKELFRSKLNEIFSQRGAGWEEQEFSKVIKLKSGQNLTAKNMVDGDYPVFGGNGIAGYHNKNNLSGKQIIIGRVGALCGNVRYLEKPFWLTDNAFQITNMKYDFDFQFLTYLLNHKNLRSLARQAAQPVISNSSLKDLVLNFPKSIKEQIKIRERINLLENEVEKIIIPYNNKLTALEELKKSILQKAFAGELTNNEIGTLQLAAEPEEKYFSSNEFLCDS